MKLDRGLWIATGVITVALAALGIIGFVTADELGGFAIIAAGFVWLVMCVPLLLVLLIRSMLRARGPSSTRDEMDRA